MSPTKLMSGRKLISIRAEETDALPPSDLQSDGGEAEWSAIGQLSKGGDS